MALVLKPLLKFVPLWPSLALAACWAFAAIGALEAAYAVVTAITSPPSFSEQQVLDCSKSGSCEGGWPGEALQFMADNFLETSKKYPYAGVKKQCKLPKSGVKATAFEEVSFSGWLGLLLAVQQQPVVVNIEASAPSFLNFKVRLIFSRFLLHTCLCMYFFTICLFCRGVAFI